MYSIPSRMDWFLRKYERIYCTIENIFYAYKIDEVNVQSKEPDEVNVQSKEPALKIDTTRFTYFSIITRVGVGTKGNSNIKKLHVRLRIFPISKTFLEPEIVLISPTDQLRKVGLVQGYQETDTGSNIGASGNINPTFNGIVSATVQGAYSKKNLLVEKATYEYDEEVQIINASGVGSLANWEFYQCKGTKPVGQYNLQIFFRVPLRPEEVKEGKRTYCIDWNVEVNTRKVIDHDWDLNNKEWNVEIDGQRLRDTAAASEIDQKSGTYKIEVSDPHFNDSDPLREKRLLRPVMIIK
jgi:hypothetical protein